MGSKTIIIINQIPYTMKELRQREMIDLAGKILDGQQEHADIEMLCEIVLKYFKKYETETYKKVTQ